MATTRANPESPPSAQAVVAEAVGSPTPKVPIPNESSTANTTPNGQDIDRSSKPKESPTKRVPKRAPVPTSARKKTPVQATGTPQRLSLKEALAAHRASIEGKPPQLPPPAPVEPEVEDACFSPKTPGCELCCPPSPGKRCAIRKLAPPFSGEQNAPPRYGRNAYTDAPCPANCRPCARCTQYDKWKFANLTPLGCDCRQRPSGIDSGFSLSTCGGYCSAIRSLLNKCPHLHPER